MVKLVLVFICVLTFQTYAVESMAQVKVSIRMQGVSLKTLIKEIERQTAVRFIYNDEALLPNRITNVHIKQEPWPTALGPLLAQVGLSFKLLEENMAVIVENPAHLSLQAFEVEGKVLDKNDQALKGVSIFEKGTSNGTTSNEEGNFNIKVKDGNAVLVFRYMGFVPQEKPVNQYLKVVLEEDLSLLNEVVVVGYGQQKKANLTGAVSTVKFEDALGNRPVSTTGVILQGAVPGLQVTRGTGEPGGGYSFNIRGTTSINGGSPFILVDNVPFNGPLNLLNPSDIESVTVLKDASSAAIYGARAAFGVILVTTKRADKNQGLRINYSNNITFSNAANLPVKASPLQTVQAYKDMGIVSYYSGQNVDQWLSLLNDYQQNPQAYPLGVAFDGGLRYQLQETDAIADFMGNTGRQQMHDFSASGGTEKSSYRISLGTVNEDGIMVTNKDSYKRYNVKGFLGTEVTSWLDAELDLGYYQSNKSLPTEASSSGYSNAVVMPSYVPLDTVLVNGESYMVGTPANFARNGGTSTEQIHDTRISGRLIARPLENMVITGEYTYDIMNQANTSYLKRMEYAERGRLTPEFNRTSSLYSTANAKTDYKALNIYGSYGMDFSEKHHTKILLGFNQEERYYEQLTASRDQMINDELPSISQAVGTLVADDNFSEFAVRGFFGRFNYDYKDKYLLEVNGRFDGSSRFPQGNRWGFFPSVSAGWRVTEESWVKNKIASLSELKIRASIGSIGNQAISEYAFIPGMPAYQSTWLVDNDRPTTLTSPSIVSGNFTWERVQTFNIGADLGLFGNRFLANFDWYMRDTKDMLTSGVELPYVLGTGAPLQNIANLRSKGFELEVNWNDKIGNVAYNLGFNIYSHKSHITKFNNEAGLLSTYFVDQRIGDIWGYQFDRYYTVDDFEAGSLNANLTGGTLRPGVTRIEGQLPNPGDVLFKDLNGDGVINPGQSTLSDPGDRSVIGNNSLQFQYGIRGGVSYKSWGLTFVVQGVGKQDVWRSNDLVFPYYYEFGTIYANQLDYWTPDNTDTFFPRIYETGTRDTRYTSNTRTQDKYLLNGAYLRLRNVTLNYRLPTSLLSKVKIAGGSVFFSAENPLTFDHLPDGLDPELSDGGRGINYPFMKSYSFGLNLNL